MATSRKTRKHITWSKADQANAEAIVEIFGDDIEANHIQPYTGQGRGGEEDINITGLIRYALTRLGNEARAIKAKREVSE